ncbi:MAG: DUF4062 domain-containing protein [Planctomycetaceae bacterium]|nr:DUF4062 domain-containing protein [Planctomycetaceae bacterium]
MAKKYQVFVSSTYLDMKEERQAAVMAILRAKHIPVGMELFSAGDKSQWESIKKWIDASDIFMLILGGRYGSLEPDSQRSYIEQEYKYAEQQDKPLFALVADENYLHSKIGDGKYNEDEVFEPDKKKQKHLKEFKSHVLTKMSAKFTHPSEILSEVLATLSDFQNREDIPGWVRENDKSIDTKKTSGLEKNIKAVFFENDEDKGFQESFMNSLQLSKKRLEIVSMGFSFLGAHAHSRCKILKEHVERNKNFHLKIFLTEPNSSGLQCRVKEEVDAQTGGYISSWPNEFYSFVYNEIYKQLSIDSKKRVTIALLPYLVFNTIVRFDDSVFIRPFANPSVGGWASPWIQLLASDTTNHFVKQANDDIEYAINHHLPMP